MKSTFQSFGQAGSNRIAVARSLQQHLLQSDHPAASPVVIGRPVKTRAPERRESTPLWDVELVPGTCVVQFLRHVFFRLGGQPEPGHPDCQLGPAIPVLAGRVPGFVAGPGRGPWLGTEARIDPMAPRVAGDFKARAAQTVDPVGENRIQLRNLVIANRARLTGDGCQRAMAVALPEVQGRQPCEPLAVAGLAFGGNPGIRQRKEAFQVDPKRTDNVRCVSAVVGLQRVARVEDEMAMFVPVAAAPAS